MTTYTYLRRDGGISRYLQYTDGAGWKYKESHDETVVMPAEHAFTWHPIAMTPFRSSHDTIVFLGDKYKLIKAEDND